MSTQVKDPFERLQRNCSLSLIGYWFYFRLFQAEIGFVQLVAVDYVDWAIPMKIINSSLILAFSAPADVCFDLSNCLELPFQLKYLCLCHCFLADHVTCLIKAGSLSPTNYPSDSFCTTACFKVLLFYYLQFLEGRKYLIFQEILPFCIGFSGTIKFCYSKITLYICDLKTCLK